MAQNPYAQYKKVEVTTNDPVKLVVMLYDGAIVAMRRAVEHIKNKEYEAKCKELMRAHDILFELLSCLDRQQGGEIAKNLESLYSYMIRRIIETNSTLDVAKADEVIRLLTTLNEAWREIARRQAGGAANEEEKKNLLLLEKRANNETGARVL